MVTAGILFFRENSHRAGNRTRDLMISRQRLWPLDHEAGLNTIRNTPLAATPVQLIVLFVRYVFHLNSFVSRKLSRFLNFMFSVYLLKFLFAASSFVCSDSQFKSFFFPSLSFLPLQDNVNDCQSVPQGPGGVFLMWSVLWSMFIPYECSVWDIQSSAHTGCVMNCMYRTGVGSLSAPDRM